MLRVLTFLIWLIFASAPVGAADWNGLIPGRSTRQDVNRKLGECPESKRQCEFNLPDEDVFITFAEPTTCVSATEDRVLLIQRDFVADASFRSLNLNRIRFKKFNASWPRDLGYQGFINDEIGLAVKTLNKLVIQIAYFPGSKEREFCPTYYANPKEFIEAVTSHAPPVTILCPGDSLPAGERITFKAEYSRGLLILLTWNATAGTIVEGQGRRRMVLDTVGLNGKTIKVSVERLDSRGYAAMDDCTIRFKE